MKSLFTYLVIPVVVSLLSACSTTLTSATTQTTSEPTLEQALAVPADDLAHSYLWVKLVSKIIPTGGGTLQLGDETITSSNAESYREKYNNRLSLYGDAINKRGYKTVSGLYTSETSESCARVQSSWVSLLHESGSHSIELVQDGFEVRFIINAQYEGQDLSTENWSVVAESAIAVLDRMNSDYFFRGIITDENIQIKPHESVLRSWPKWADPPSRSDLEKCTILLMPAE